MALGLAGGTWKDWGLGKATNGVRKITRGRSMGSTNDRMGHGVTEGCLGYSVAELGMRLIFFNKYYFYKNLSLTRHSTVVDRILNSSKCICAEGLVILGAGGTLRK